MGSPVQVGEGEQKIQPLKQFRGFFYTFTINIIEITNIKSAMKFKIEDIISFLKSRQGAPIDGLLLRITDSDEVEVDGWSSFKNPDFLPKATALLELQEIKQQFSEIREAFPDLDKFIANKNVFYVLCISDSGKVSFEICREINGNVNWSVELKW